MAVPREVLWLPLFIRQETEHVQVIKIFTRVTRLVRDGVWPQSLYLGLSTDTLREDMKDLYSAQ